MFLKTLQIKGFKSFADTATLQLEPGVTVVVGPNGSGKSNVVDAIGWVLGAQKPSTVRSQKMDDVIFAGSSNRAALGRAEVSLTIDNSTGILPIEFNEVTITRTLFRSGDSDYKINGVSCRLLDIQDLLSDSGVGRQQHVIISQGQIDAVLNAKPEDRRQIIEEAAGVLKFRRRKEKSERRLASTEANLLRIQDLLREVRRQLRPLERQAEAARRHGEVTSELSALRLHLAGRDLARLRTQLAQGVSEHQTLKSAEREIKSRLATLDAGVLEAEARLGASGGDDFGDVLVRYESLRERGRGLASLLVERRRGIERDRNAYVDQGVVASIEADHARLLTELTEVEAESAQRGDRVAEVEAAEAALSAARINFESNWAETSVASSSEAAELRGELAALTASVKRTESDRAREHDKLERAESNGDRAAGEAVRLAAEFSELEDRREHLTTQAETLQTQAEAAEHRLVSAEANAHQAATEYSHWAARAEALSLALDQARQRAGAAHLADLDGVIGTLLDVVEVDPGWETAFEAAAGEALAAVVVADRTVARQALAALEEGELTGAVLALGTGHVGAAPPAIGTSIRAKVRGIRPGVDDLLDLLVGNAVAVSGGIEALFDAAVSHPTAVVVTQAGDRFAATGWRVGGTGGGATGAALVEATEGARDAQLLAERTAEELVTARAAAKDLRNRANEATRERDAALNRIAVLTSASERASRDATEATAAAGSQRVHLEELDQLLTGQLRRQLELQERLPALEAAEAEVAQRARAMAQARQSLEAQSSEVVALRNGVEVRFAALVERQRSLVERIAHTEERMARHHEERVLAQQRRVELDARAEATELLIAFVNRRLEVVEIELVVLRTARREQSEATRALQAELETLRSQRSTAERELEQLREKIQRAEIAEAETKMRLESATEHLRSELDAEPEAAIAAPCPELPDGLSAPVRLRELEREVRLMGPINPLALQEFEALQERHEFLETQLEDIRSTRRELGKVIRAVDEEIVNVFAAAYADVSANFQQLFDMLFPGGHGALVLTDPSDLLNTGIEIEARPSGKNVRKLSLLSGGERSLTALAYLFAVFRSRPSPFYVMDEVEAALDDVNLHRFLALVAEFRSTAQLLIVSHQKRTMEAADVLYGVTMEKGGSSRVLSEKVGSALPTG